MVVSKKLDRFFDEKIKEYPTRRSFLVPMLLYTQDEIGYVTDEAIAYLAKKSSITAGKSWALVTSRRRLTACSHWKKLNALERAPGRRQYK